MKKAVIGVSTLLSVSLLAACGGQASSSGDNENEVSLWVHMSEETAEGEALKATVDRFNEEHGDEYQATIEFIPRSGSGGGYEDKINAALTTNTLPDVLTLDGPNTAAYAEAQMIAPLDDFISNKDDLLPSIIEQGTYNGELYAVGYSESNVGVFYNKEMFEEAGIDLNSLPTVEDPWTWDEFNEISQTLTDHHGVPAIDLGLSDQSEWLMYAFTPFLWSQGGAITNEDGSAATGTFNNEDAVESMSFLWNLLDKGYTTATPIEKGFHTGEYPMLLSGSWTIAEMETSYPDVSYSILPYPVSPETNELVSPSGSWQYAMSATTEKSEAAGALIDFMMSTESLTEVTLANSVLPATYSVIDEVQGQVPEEMQILIDQNSQTGQARPVLAAYPQISRAFQQTISDLAYQESESDLQRLLDEKAAQMDQALN